MRKGIIIVLLLSAILYFFLALLFFNALSSGLNPVPCHLANCPEVTYQPRSYYYLAYGLPALTAILLAVSDVIVACLIKIIKPRGFRTYTVFSLVVLVGLIIYIYLRMWF